MQHHTTDQRQNQTPDSHWRKPSRGKEGRRSKHILDVEAGVEKEDAEHSVLEEEGENHWRQRFHFEDVRWYQWLFGNPAFDIDKDAEQDPTEDETDENVGRGPAVGCVGAIRQPVHDEDQCWDDGESTPPVHSDFVRLLRLHTPGDGKDSCYRDHGEDDCADEEVPAPVQKLCGNSGKEDAGEEAHTGQRTVEAEDEILTRSGSILRESVKVSNDVRTHLRRCRGA